MSYREDNPSDGRVTVLPELPGTDTGLMVMFFEDYTVIKRTV